jgi:hypothetical protein
MPRQLMSGGCDGARDEAPGRPLLLEPHARVAASAVDDKENDGSGGKFECTGMRAAAFLEENTEAPPASRALILCFGRPWRLGPLTPL